MSARPAAPVKRSVASGSRRPAAVRCGGLREVAAKLPPDLPPLEPDPAPDEEPEPDEPLEPALPPEQEPVPA